MRLAIARSRSRMADGGDKGGCDDRADAWDCHQPASLFVLLHPADELGIKGCDPLIDLGPLRPSVGDEHDHPRAQSCSVLLIHQHGQELLELPLALRRDLDASSGSTPRCFHNRILRALFDEGRAAGGEGIRLMRFPCVLAPETGNLATFPASRLWRGQQVCGFARDVSANVHSASLARLATWRERTEDWLKKAGAAFSPTA